MKKYILFLIIFLGIGLADYCFAAEDNSFIFMTWEADSLAPIGYQGKLLPTSFDSVVKVVASSIVKGVFVEGLEWEYKWYLNGELDTKGIGEKVFRFRLQKTDYNATSYTVKVVIYSDDAIIGQKEMVINLIKPKVLISVDGGSGINNDDVVVLNTSQAILSARYYFFSGASGDLKTTWYIDGSRSKNLDSSGNLILDSSVGDNVDVSVLIERISEPLIRGIGSLNINF